MFTDYYGIAFLCVRSGKTVLMIVPQLSNTQYMSNADKLIDSFQEDTENTKSSSE